MSASEFSGRIALGDKLELKEATNSDIPYLPAIVIDDDHAYLAWPLGQGMRLKTSFTYGDIAAAFDNARNNA